jgi:hypothetical protein
VFSVDFINDDTLGNIIKTYALTTKFKVGVLSVALQRQSGWSYPRPLKSFY